tara:strand:+ start:705 stop:920 length:216 start_codon:yes stop_codon:yes gene_type:complete
MTWFEILKRPRKKITRGVPPERKVKPKRSGLGTKTTPRGSKQAQLERLVNQLIAGKITEAQYKAEKKKLGL